VRSYECPKSRESKPGQFWDFTLGVPGQEPFECGCDGVTQRILYGEGGGFPRARAVVSQVSPGLPVACSNIGSVPNVR
jgi:hypothetical protein